MEEITHGILFVDVRDRNNAYHTGIGSAGETPAKSLDLFLDIKRKFEVPQGHGDFMVDYFDDAGDLVDSIEVTTETVEKLIGEPVESTEFYKKIDEEIYK